MATLITGSGVDKVIDGSIVDADIVGVSSSKLTGALPAISGASLTSLTSGNLTGALPVIDGSNLTGVSGGKILNVYQDVTTSALSPANNTWVDTDMSITLTPTSSSSKFLCFWDCHVYSNPGNSSRWETIQPRLMRDTTAVYTTPGNDTGIYQYYVKQRSAYRYLDAPTIPATPVAITYKVQVYAIDIANMESQSVLIIMEVGA